MAAQIACPKCTSEVRVPPELVGTRVQCPACDGVFTAEVSDVPIARLAPDPHVSEFDLVGSIPRYRFPHRGETILWLAIGSLTMCAPLGIAAWVLANNDLDAMRRGQMNSSGESMTKIGRGIAIASTILHLVLITCGAIAFVLNI